MGGDARDAEAGRRASALQLDGEHEVGELGGPVGVPRAPAPGDEPVGVDPPAAVDDARDGHDAGPGGRDQHGEEQPGEGEVAEVVDPDHRIALPPRGRPPGGDESGVGDEQVEASPGEAHGEVAHRRRIAEVERHDLGRRGARRRGPHGVRRPCAAAGVAARHQHPETAGGEARGARQADARRRARHQRHTRARRGRHPVPPPRSAATLTGRTPRGPGPVRLRRRRPGLPPRRPWGRGYWTANSV